MALMLIDDRAPPPGTSPGTWSPNWPMWGWIAVAAVVGFAAINAEGAVGAALAIACFGCTCRAFAVALPYGDGLREWRQ